MITDCNKINNKIVFKVLDKWTDCISANDIRVYVENLKDEIRLKMKNESSKKSEIEMLRIKINVSKKFLAKLESL